MGIPFANEPWNNPRMLPPEIYRPVIDLSVVETDARVKRSSSRRSTSDKMGEATRLKWRTALVKKYGALCHLCVARGVDEALCVIDMTLKWPERMCFTRDHVKPRSLGGRDSLANQRPAHRWCNESRGNRSVAEWIERVGETI